MTACDGSQVEPLTATPYIIYVTPTESPETVEASPQSTLPSVVTAMPTPTAHLVGPSFDFGGSAATSQPEPTLDLADVTLVPDDSQVPELSPQNEQQETESIPNRDPSYLYSDRLGLNFISSAHHDQIADRMTRGLEAGAGWDRVAVYWSEIETVPDQFEWNVYDAAIRRDVENGLRTDTILLGVPQIYNDGRGVPQLLDQPVFADGTDVPGSNKRINEANPWAEFVFKAVRRYRPDGILARREGWADGAGVNVWEIWNEPDFSVFWSGTIEDYARLLKVAYLAARHADPNARIMVGGLVLFEQPGWLPALLSLYSNDPDPVEAIYPFDIVALHSYSHPPFTFHAVQRTESLLAFNGLDYIPIWLNESGVAVWDDYPGPSWTTSSEATLWRARSSEQADYIIQNAAYAFMAGAEVLFHFQLYDDCGNQPFGTTFPSHDGSLCDAGLACAGDALGLMRNAPENVCFNQHPEPNSARPGFSAYQVVADVLAEPDVVPLSASRGSLGNQIWLAFANPTTNELVRVIWNDTGIAGEAVVPARGTEAQLITSDGTVITIPVGEDGSYHVILNPATNQNQGPDHAAEFMIGGPPVILIEQLQSPIVSIVPLLDVSRSAFVVKWQTTDLNLDRYEIWYRDDTEDGDWIRWFETESPGEALFVGGTGRRYSFFARGVTSDGAWTTNSPFPQATTVIES